MRCYCKRSTARLLDLFTFPSSIRFEIILPRSFVHSPHFHTFPLPAYTLPPFTISIALFRFSLSFSLSLFFYFLALDVTRRISFSFFSTDLPRPSVALQYTIWIRSIHRHRSLARSTVPFYFEYAKCNCVEPHHESSGLRSFEFR